MCTALAFAVALLAAPPVATGTQLSYTGSLAPVKAEQNPITKRFELTYVSLGEAPNIGWSLTESGRGGWTWLDRFGRSDATLPALLYEREDGRSVAPISGPVFSAPVQLDRGATWEEDRLEYRVSGQATRAARTCWVIEVRSPYGHKRTVWVEQASGLVVAMRETVFMGQGQEHRLNLELVEAKTLTADELDRAAAALEAWTGLRDKLGWKSRGMRTELSSEQIATLKAELPRLLRTLGRDGFLSDVAAAAEKDAQGQKNRAGAVAALRDAIIGQPLGDLKLTELGGKTVTSDELAGKVVVFHFWEYRDSPLEEPYGQTGYLDYLLRRRGASGVVVYGVHVDSQLADVDGRRASLAAARRLKAFMNLSYPILLDDGALLKRLGDPRPAGSKLPLFAVIGKDGKIAEYHAGLYDVRANEGLSELDEAITTALGRR
jgi:AhpC/TSA family